MSPKGEPNVVHGFSQFDGDGFREFGGHLANASIVRKHPRKPRHASCPETKELASQHRAVEIRNGPTATSHARKGILVVVFDSWVPAVETWSSLQIDHQSHAMLRVKERKTGLSVHNLVLVVTSCVRC